MSSTNETIRFVDLVAQYHRYKDELSAAISDTLEATAFIGGPALGRFEKGFAALCGTQHCVGVGNGTDAIFLALKALGVGPGDEVITACNTFIATSEAVTMAGATPVFVDVDDDTALMDVSKLEAAITPATKAIIPVHLYGQLVPMAEVMAVAKKHDLFVIEDSAQAHAAIEGGVRAGATGHAGCFSFYPGKNLGAYGDAGGVVTNDLELAEKVRMLANHGRADKFGHVMEGVNSRLDGLQAAILEVKLRHLETWTAERQAAAKRYDALLADIPQVRLPKVRAEGAHVFHLYVIRCPDRDGLRAFLGERNIQTGIHYPVPLHLLKAYEHQGNGPGTFPVAEKMAEEIVSLPISPEITEAQQVRVAEAIREFMSRSEK
ncbi:MAG: DegT/DnrJ/EryC1/StrS family aminotransferase [Deltaproteobacteria bacterium]|nr:DegT/DnrJ/EryC1/StrS family aminotransferase [Deltaproteobacteria bacterium]